MALFYEGMTCPFCHKGMRKNDKIFVSGEGIFPPNHPWFAFCDTAMHWDCYERWPHRAEFTRSSFQVKVAIMKHNEYWAIVLLSEDVLVSVGLAAGEVGIFLAETGTDIRVPISLWNLWIRSKWIVLRKRSALVKRGLSEVLLVLRTNFPNTKVLMDKANQIQRGRA